MPLQLPNPLAPALLLRDLDGRFGDSVPDPDGDDGVALMQSDEERIDDEEHDDDDRREVGVEDGRADALRRRGTSSSVEGGDVRRRSDVPRSSSHNRLDRERGRGRGRVAVLPSSLVAPLLLLLLRLLLPSKKWRAAAASSSSPLSGEIVGTGVNEATGVALSAPAGRRSPSTQTTSPSAASCPTGGLAGVAGAPAPFGAATSPSLAGVSSGDVQLLHSAQGLSVPVVPSSPLLLRPLHGSMLEHRDDSGEGEDIMCTWSLLALLPAAHASANCIPERAEASALPSHDDDGDRCTGECIALVDAEEDGPKGPARAMTGLRPEPSCTGAVGESTVAGKVIDGADIVASARTALSDSVSAVESAFARNPCSSTGEIGVFGASGVAAESSTRSDAVSRGDEATSPGVAVRIDSCDEDEDESDGAMAALDGSECSSTVH